MRLRRIVRVIATDADEKPLRQVNEAIGNDNIVVSTDYPDSDGLFPTAIEEFVHLEGVTDKSKSKILWDSCARLYNLAGARWRRPSPLGTAKLVAFAAP